MSDIDAALAVLDTKYILIDGHDAKDIDAAITLALNALTTLRDLKQELKENGDMPLDIWGILNTMDIYEGTFDALGEGDPNATQYTRTTPTLKKILGDL